MIKLEKTEVFGWESAIRGMRNPMNSWDKIDSWGDETGYHIGFNDLDLMKKLSKAGSDHSKYLRMITVTCDITAPLYWWKEYDTYKVGTVANSCSTMHKLHAKEFELADFSWERLNNRSLEVLETVIDELNFNRNAFIETKDKSYWHQMIQLLPTSYEQKRTVHLNYAVLKNMYFARKNHKLDEWRTLCEWAENLPYFKEICTEEVKSLEVVRCRDCKESEVCPDTLLWCNQNNNLVPPMGYCHCGERMDKGERNDTD